MNYETIAQIILSISLAGIVVIILQKIPALNRLPETFPQPTDERKLVLKIKDKIKTIPPFKYFSFDIFLQKILSKIRILSLKTDNKTFNWLQKLREKARKKQGQNDNYWEEVKTSLPDDKDSTKNE